MRSSKLNNLLRLVIFYSMTLFCSSFVIAGENDLRNSLESDMQYYERVVKPRGINARINFLNRVIQKYEDKGLDSIYLISVEEELKTLQHGKKRPSPRKRKTYRRHKRLFDDSRGLLGSRYLSFSGGILIPGNSETKELVGTITGFDADINIPFDYSIDLGLNINQTNIKNEGEIEGYPFKIDGKSTCISVNFLYHFIPGEKIDPYISVGILHGKTVVKFEDKVYGQTFEDKDDDTGYGASVGFQLTGSENYSIIPSVAYFSIFDESDTGVSLILHIWTDETVGLGVKGIYWSDEGDVGLTGALTISF